MAGQRKSNQPDKFRKPFIVLTIALVLIMLVYSLYYYTVSGKKELTYLADADTLTHTTMVLLQNEVYNSNGKNVLWPASLQTFIETGEPDTNRSNMLHRHSVTRIGKVSGTLEDDVNESLEKKFPKHPPVYIQKDKDTTRIYSYLFKKLNLPAVELSTLDFSGKEVSAIVVWAGQWQFKVAGNDTLLRLPLKGDKEHLLLAKGLLDSSLFAGNWQMGEGPALLHLPLMDFMLTKDYHLRRDYPELQPKANPATQVVKFMIAPEAVDKKVHKQITSATRTFTYNKPFILALQGAGAAKPYLIIKIENTQLLRK